MTYDTVVFDNDGVLVGRTHFEVLRDATQENLEVRATDKDTVVVEDDGIVRHTT